MKEIFELERLLMNGLPYSFLLEVIFRCFVMYFIAILVLKLVGRRGIKQLSVFELVIILTLGSAAGDPLFYEDVGLIPAITVFVIILILYRTTTHIISKSKKIEEWLEGKPVILIENGEFSTEHFEKEDLAQDEFFAELRLRNVEHLGQVKLAILETNGQISVFFFEEKEVLYGLPITPKLFYEKLTTLEKDKIYACTFCGHTHHQIVKSTSEMICENCKRREWALALNNKRVA
jgi:uncharacterized membrane protein YcaP (DUF421 family)